MKNAPAKVKANPFASTRPPAIETLASAHDRIKATLELKKEK